MAAGGRGFGGAVCLQLKNCKTEQGGGKWVVGEKLLPLLLRLIKTAPTFLLNHPASQRTKHFYQCLYLGKQ